MMPNRQNLRGPVRVILLDASNLFYGTALDFFTNTKEKMTMESVRYVLTSRLAVVARNMRSYGTNRVLAFDDRRYWRRQVFPHYKAHRAAERAKSKFDWDKFLGFYDLYQDELKEFFPFKSIKVDFAEADDVIAILAPRMSPHEKVCIGSSDTDNLQLQFIDPSIEQMSFKTKKMITPKNSEYSLFDHIVRGDAGDGIPNIYSDADHFVQPDKKRQKSVMAVNVAEWERHAHEPEKFCSDKMLARFNQNRMLIDYKFIPPSVATAIVDAYETAEAPKGKLFGYMVANRMTRVMQEGGL